MIGEKFTKGMGKEPYPEIGKRAAEESLEEISEVLMGFGIVFIVSGMGGSTGTGAVQNDHCVNGIEKIKEHVDSLIMIPNDKLLDIVDRRTTMPEALGKVDEVILHAVRGITDLINVPANINQGFADVKKVFKDKGIANIGFGSGKGEDKVMDAVEMAGWSIFMETSIVGAKHVLINVSGDVDLADYYDAVSYVHELAGSGANIVGGLVYDKSDSDTCNVTIIATGLDEQ